MNSESGSTYTFEKLNKGKLNRFRCDLAILNSSLLGFRPHYSIDHSTRIGENRFTDHSAILVNITI
jgi:hypothetical protein